MKTLIKTRDEHPKKVMFISTLVLIIVMGIVLFS
jgi:hypothetical protein